MLMQRYIAPCLSIVLAALLMTVTVRSEELSVSPWLSDRDIHQLVQEFAKSELIKAYDAEVIIRSSSIDPRLKLKRCDKFLTLSMQEDSAQIWRNTVKVSCDDLQNWSLYVPVQIEAWKEVPTLAAPAQKGQMLHAGDLIMRKQNLARLQNRYLADTNLIIGKALTRPLAAGSTISPDLLVEPDLVKKGDHVLLTVGNSRIRVSTMAIAQENGKQGETIKVENTSSNQKVSAKITGQTKVEILL